MATRPDHKEYLDLTHFEFKCDRSAFTSQEIGDLTKYGNWLTALTLALIGPTTELQSNFIKSATGKTCPSSHFEILWEKLVLEREKHNAAYQLSPEDISRQTSKSGTSTRDPNELKYSQESKQTYEIPTLDEHGNVTYIPCGPERKTRQNRINVAYVEIYGNVQKLTEKAVLFDIDGLGPEWIPKSQIDGRVSAESECISVSDRFIEEKNWDI